MKNAISILVVFVICITAISAQPKDFEGNAVYKINVKSKIEGISETAWKNTLLLGDSMNIIMKQGNYKQSTGMIDMYFISKDEKAYFKFQGIDTLFYMDYSADTSTVIDISKSDVKKSIVGLDCKSITIKTSSTTRNFYYPPSLYMNPEYDKNNKLGCYNVFAKETSSIYLGYFEETDSYIMTENCTRLQPGPIEKSVFELPALPKKMFSAELIIVPPKFSGRAGFDKYIQTNIDPSVSAKYIKIPRGEDNASQTATVLFMINEKGRVLNAHIVNKDQVHPKIAEEAVRVISASPPWTPASIIGGKTFFWTKYSITFQTSRK